MLCTNWSNMNFKNTILLTGAGFTANFGGFLGREMWAKIFNNPKLNDAKNIKAELKKGFDFEKVYSAIFNSRGSFSPEEIEIFEEAVNEAYLAMDEVIKQPSWWDTSGIHPADLKRFLDFFQNEEDGKAGAVFTLNQDLFLERHFGWQPLVPRTMQYGGSQGNLDQDDLNSNGPKRLPTEDELAIYKAILSNQSSYIKLHGSSRWTSEDGSNTKVIGINKIETINKIPLLKWYLELFEQALYRPNVKLLSMGYGFGDEHINSCISKASIEHGLKLYIISTEKPNDFSFRMRFKYPAGTAINEQDNTKLPIWNAVEGYFPYYLNRVFPKSQAKTTEKSEIYKSLGISG